MGFGAVIAAGENNEQLADALLGALVEVRVEQSLDDPTLFALRFEEDVCEGEPTVLDAPPLRPEQMLTVAVGNGKKMRCLVRGPVTEVKCSVKTGGPGSTVQVHGQDRRVELDRQCVQYPWPVLASDAAHSILEAYDFVPEVEPTTKQYSEETGTLNQSESDLAFLRRIADMNGRHLWLTYTCEADKLDPLGRKLEVTETAHLAPSPAPPDGAPAVAVPVASADSVRLRVHVADPCQRNVTAFDLEMDVERPTGFDVEVVDEKTLSPDRATAENREDALRPGAGLVEIANRPRTLCLDGAGDAADAQTRAEAALGEAGWFVNATASTTAYLLGDDVLKPHDVVEVEGLGKRHSGAYQVTAVTHVITATGHHMDLTLRSNALGEE